MNRIAVFTFLTVLSLASLRAGEISQEVNLDYSLVGGADTQFGFGKNGSVSEQSNLVRYITSTPIFGGPLLRLGMEWQRFSFSLPASANIPDTLQSNDLVLGMDLELFGLLMRIEAMPGFYGDSNNLQGKNFNVPFLIGGSYIASGDLQWIAGLRVDVNSRYPVFGVVGMRWKFTDKWVIDAILPRPRLEYEFSKTLTLFAGGEIKEGTFRVNRDFGNLHGNPALNNAALDYAEVHAGAGASWKISSNLKVDLEAGYMPFREFNFHRADVDIQTNSGAAYGQIIIGSQF